MKMPEHKFLKEGIIFPPIDSDYPDSYASIEVVVYLPGTGYRIGFYCYDTQEWFVHDSNVQVIDQSKIKWGYFLAV